MRRRSSVLLALALIAPGGDGFDAGARAFAEGRFAAAAAAFAAELDRLGAAAPPELACDLALAALMAGDEPAALAACARVTQADGPAGPVGPVGAAVAFVRATVAWRRGEHAERLARQVEAEPFAVKSAIDLVGAARRAWVDAAVAWPDWPEARRNAERASRKLGDLHALQMELERHRRGAGAQQRPMLVPDGGDAADAKGAPAGGNQLDSNANPLQPLATELSPAAVADLFARLDRKEQQKRQLREQERRSQRAAVERDW